MLQEEFGDKICLHQNGKKKVWYYGLTKKNVFNYLNGFEEIFKNKNGNNLYKQ